MSVDTETIDRIVANVLGQLSAPEMRSPPPPMPQAAAVSAAITDRVITADTLAAVGQGATVTVPGKAIITPAARDVAKERNIQLVRDAGAGNSASTTQSLNPQPSTLNLLIVRHTEPLERVLHDQLPTARRELLGCPDDAAKLAISDICRGNAAMVLIFAGQTHRVACLANRNEKVKAAVVRDAGDVRSVREQLRVNVWCIDPAGQSYFELRNLLREIQSALSDASAKRR